MPIKLPSIFLPSKPKVMTHEAFETLVVNMGKQAEMAKKERANGKPNAGKLGYFKSDKNSVQVGSDVIFGGKKRPIGKASAKQNKEAVKRLITYLNAYQQRTGPRDPADPPIKKNAYEPRYNGALVFSALISLRAIGKDKNFDVTVLAEPFEKLVPLAERRSNEALANSTYDATMAIAKTIEALKMKPTAQANAHATPCEGAQADAAFQKACRHAEACRQNFEVACGQFPQGGNGSKLIEWIDSKLFDHSVTAGYTVSSMKARLDTAYRDVGAAHDRLEDLRGLLNADLQSGKRPSPALYQSISLQSQLVMRKMSLYLQRMATVGALLSRTPYFGTDPVLRKPLLELAEALAKQGEACTHPDGAFMHIYQRAAMDKNMADAQLLELQAPAPTASVDSAEARLQQTGVEAKEAYEAFDKVALGLPPQRSASAPPPSAEQMDLRHWMQDWLVRNPATAYLPVPQVKSTLFDSLPKRIDELEGKLRDTVEECNGSGFVTSVQKSLLLAVCAELDQTIDAYIEQLEGVSAALLSPNPEDNTPVSDDVVSLRSLRKKAGHLMQNLAFAHRDPQGHLMGFKAYVQRVLDELNRPVAEDQTLAREPAHRRRGFVEAPPTPALSTVAKTVRSKSVGAINDLSPEFKAELKLLTMPIHVPSGKKDSPYGDRFVPPSPRADNKEEIDRALLDRDEGGTLLRTAADTSAH